MKNFFDDRLKKMTLLALGMLTFFLLAESLGVIAEINFRKQTLQSNNITFRGTAEIDAIFDVATFSVTIREEEKDLVTAQQKMSDKANELLALFDRRGVEKKDIKTTNYNTSPKYIYPVTNCRSNVCPPIKPVLTGFEATQTLSIKLRDIAKSGEILTSISQLGIAEVNGPSFTVDDTAKLKTQAQALAINKAKAEAKLTAKNLGVKLGKIVRFSEDQSQFDSRPNAMLRMSSESMPQVETGQHKITAAVAITYEITQ